MPSSPLGLGRYEVIADIGRGGMADVKLAVQRGPAGFEKLVVLKLVHAELANDKDAVDMLLAEAKLSARIKHANVVDVYELGEADGRYFIAMEYLEGESLLAILEQGATANKRLDPLSMARVIADTAEGLEAAHALDVVHHDISLGNIFVLYSGQVKLLDFGVAKAARKSVTKIDKLYGKLAYMAPEKLDERPGDRRSDLWSLGCVLWEGLAYKRLFKGNTPVELIREVRYVNVPPPSQVNPEVPAALDAIVLKALQRDPSRRFRTAKEMASAIEEVLAATSYPSKNYRIATYMMQTFADHVAARARLRGPAIAAGSQRPSAEVIEAAFGDANQVVLPEGSTGADVATAIPGSAPPPSGVLPLSATLATTTDELAIPGAPPPPSAAVAIPDAPPPNPFAEDELVETTFDVVPANAEASRALRYEADPSWIRSKHGDSLKELQRRAQELRENPGAVRRRRLRAYAAGGAAMLVVMIIVIARACGGDREPEAVAKPVDDPPIAIDAAVATAIAIDAADVVADEEIEMPPEEASRPDDEDKPKPRPKPTKSAQKLYAEGLAAYNKKDLKTAYARFTDGRRADSRYPNNWYGLGMVHERAGRKRDARVAYERYLKLAPNAANSKKLREHIRKKL